VGLLICITFAARNKNLFFHQTNFNVKMNHYEVTFIIDPVLSGDELKSTASTYQALLQDQGCNIVHVQEMGLRQLAYPINKKSSGVYYCIEFSAATGAAIPKTELAFRRDERIMRFLTVKLDKYGVKYNEDRRNGVISAYKKKESKKRTFDGAPVREESAPAASAPAPAAPAPVAAPEPAPAPVVEAVVAPVTPPTAPVAANEEE
jgi:small subunit ribosomal protein S6